MYHQSSVLYSLRSVISYVLPLEKYSEVIFIFALPAVFFAQSEAASVGVPCALMHALHWPRALTHRTRETAVCMPVCMPHARICPLACFPFSLSFLYGRLLASFRTSFFPSSSIRSTTLLLSCFISLHPPLLSVAPVASTSMEGDRLICGVNWASDMAEISEFREISAEIYF